MPHFALPAKYISIQPKLIALTHEWIQVFHPNIKTIACIHTSESTYTLMNSGNTQEYYKSELALGTIFK
jgi:hypothetical protein